MSNEEFLNRLETALRDRVPREDVDDAMNYHREYFSEAGENAAEELPAPEAVAEQIVREREEYLRKGTRKVWVKPAVIGVLCVGIAVTAFVGWGTKSFFRNVWENAFGRSDRAAYTVEDSIQQATIVGGTGGKTLVTTEQGDQVCISGELEPFESIVVEGVSDNVTITAAGGEFWLDINHDKKEIMDCNVQDGTLYIHGDMDGMVNLGYKGGEVNITVPWGINLYQVQVDTDLGNIYMVDVSAEDVELDADLGDITVSGGEFGALDCDSNLGDVSILSVTADSLKCYCDTGNVTATEFVARETELEADLGNVEAIAVGARSDYSLELEVDLGKLKVDGQKMGSPYVTTGTYSFSLKAEADVGNVTVDFTNESSIPAPPDPPEPPSPPELATIFQ